MADKARGGWHDMPPLRRRKLGTDTEPSEPKRTATSAPDRPHPPLLDSLAGIYSRAAAMAQLESPEFACDLAIACRQPQVMVPAFLAHARPSAVLQGLAHLLPLSGDLLLTLSPMHNPALPTLSKVDCQGLVEHALKNSLALVNTLVDFELVNAASLKQAQARLEQLLTRVANADEENLNRQRHLTECAQQLATAKTRLQAAEQEREQCKKGEKATMSELAEVQRKTEEIEGRLVDSTLREKDHRDAIVQAQAKLEEAQANLAERHDIYTRLQYSLNKYAEGNEECARLTGILNKAVEDAQNLMGLDAYNSHKKGRRT